MKTSNKPRKLPIQTSQETKKEMPAGDQTFSAQSCFIPKSRHWNQIAPRELASDGVSQAALPPAAPTQEIRTEMRRSVFQCLFIFRGGGGDLKRNASVYENIKKQCYLKQTGF